jgi:hypothetical protein
MRVRFSFRFRSERRTPILGYYSRARRLVLWFPPLYTRQFRSWLVGDAFPILLFDLNARCGESLALCPCRNRLGRREKRDAIYAVFGDELFHPVPVWPSQAPLACDYSEARAADPGEVAASEREVELGVALCGAPPHGG